MSSTKRGSQRSEADNYATPSWCTTLALGSIPGLPPAGKWMDPCAGDGSIIRAAGLVYPGIEWSACEIRSEAEERLAATGAKYTIGDFLSGTYKPDPVDVIFTNPPFRLAHEFVDKSLSLAKQVVMLLRLNFLGSESRAPFLRQYAPDVYVLPNRPSFVSGTTDSIEYAWFVWVSGRLAQSGQYRVLPSTPRSERRTTQPIQVVDWKPFSDPDSKDPYEGVSPYDEPK